MRPFRVGGDYDRPIARRLLEEAGVSRELFGHSKNAVNVNLFFGERQMSEASRRDMQTFVARRAGPWRLAGESVFGMVHYGVDVGLGRVDNAFSRAVARRPQLHWLARRANWYMRHNWDLETRYYFSCVLIWALTRVGERYASATAEPASSAPRGKSQPDVVSTG